MINKELICKSTAKLIKSEGNASIKDERTKLKKLLITDRENKLRNASKNETSKTMAEHAQICFFLYMFISSPSSSSTATLQTEPPPFMFSLQNDNQSTTTETTLSDLSGVPTPKLNMNDNNNDDQRKQNLIRHNLENPLKINI